MTKSKSKSNGSTSSQTAVAARPQPQQASLLKQATKFFGTTAGLDLTLRFFHGLVVITTHHPNELLSSRSLLASAQLNLARRFLRFFVLFDCIQALLETSAKTYSSLALKTLDLAEWGCLLGYFVLENLTMLHDMNLHTVSWYNPVLIEANKFWFYAIGASIVRTIIQRLGLISSSSSVTKKGKSAVTSPPTPPLRKVVVDSLDLMLPASFIGWVVLSDVTIGCSMTVSTLLVWRDVWAKAQ